MQLHWKCSPKVECSSWGPRVENMIVHLLLDCSSMWNTIVPHQIQIGTKIDPAPYHNHKGSNWGHTHFDYKHHGLPFIDREGRFLECLTDLNRNLTVHSSHLLPAQSNTSLISHSSRGLLPRKREKGVEVSYFNRREMEEIHRILWEADLKPAYSNHVHILKHRLGVQSWLPRSLIADMHSYNFHLNRPMSPCRSTQEEMVQ